MYIYSCRVQATFVDGEDGPVIAVLAGGTLYIHNIKDGAQTNVQALPNRLVLLIHRVVFIRYKFENSQILVTF